MTKNTDTSMLALLANEVGYDPLCIRPVSARFQVFSACQFQGMSSSMRLIL